VMRKHLCKMLEAGNHNLSVKQLKLKNGTVQWFLVNEKHMHAECVVFCPYCGTHLLNFESEAGDE
jgi:hypothetical protein